MRRDDDLYDRELGRGSAGLGARSKDPDVPDGDDPVFEPHEGEAFRRDASGARIPPRALDVDQGFLGDCWLLAAMAAVAHRDPEHIENRVQRRSDGRYEVKIGTKTVIVTRSFPAEGYADPTPNRQRDTLWAALVEKAFAQVEGSYAKLIGGSPADAMTRLTGRTSTTTRIGSSTTVDQLYGLLLDAQRKDHPATFSTRNGIGTTVLVGDHAYAVLEVFEKSGKKWARLYNPWGTNDGKRNENKVVIEVEIARMVRDGERICVNSG